MNYSQTARHSGWMHRETKYHPNDEALAATRFFLGNGFLGVRGSLDELGTHGVQGCYAAGFFRRRLVHQFETADTYTRKKLIFDEEIMPRPAPVYEIQGLPDLLFCRLTIGGEVFRMWEGEVTGFERTLDLGTGLLTRKVEWCSPGGLRAVLVFERFLAWDIPELMFQRITVRAVDPLALEVAPGLDGSLEPRLGVGELVRGKNVQALRVEAAGTEIPAFIGQAWSLEQEGKLSDAAGEEGEVAGRPVVRYFFELPAGGSVTFVRAGCVLVGNYPAHVGADATKALDLASDALGRGFDDCLASSTKVLKAKWEMADIVLDGPERDQVALRYSLYQLLAAAPWNYDHISIAAKCLSGPGYNGHVFWDTDINILPFYQWVFPSVAANHCRYRHRMLDDARKLAAGEGRPGARYPWQSALEGLEQAPEFIRCSRTQIHVVADVAFAADRLGDISGGKFPESVAEIAIECARYLRTRLTWNGEAGRFEIHGVGGPDEYHPVTNNNAYTNYLTAWLLGRAAELAGEFPGLATRLGVTSDERRDWAAAAAKLFLPLDPETGLIPQCDGFFGLDETWEEVGGNWGGIGAEFYKCKALKQPDVLLLLTLFPEKFSPEVLRRNWDYYERFILHGSSLSPSIHALVAARIGLPQRARYYFDLAANFEFTNHNRDTQHGIHIGNCGGIWQAMVFGFAGLRQEGEELVLDPCLPAEWRRVTFHVAFRGVIMQVSAGNTGVEVRALAENPATLNVRVFGDSRRITPGTIHQFSKNHDI